MGCIHFASFLNKLSILKFGEQTVDIHQLIPIVQIGNHRLTDDSRKRLFCQNGFTIFEMLIVLFFISVLSAIAYPNFLEWNQNNKLRGDARALYSTLQNTKMKAIRNYNNAVITFNAPANAYLSFIDNGGTTGTSGDGIFNGDEEIVASGTISNSIVTIWGVFSLDGVNFSLGNITPGFTSRGLPLSNRTEGVVLRRANSTSLWYRVTLSVAGGTSLQTSTNSTDGSNGTWN